MVIYKKVFNKLELYGENAMLTQRLGSSTQKNPDFIDKLVNTIKSNPGCCDEVWFASDYGFPPLEVHKKTAETIMEQAEKFRDIGIRVSLQISNTIGHGQYMKSQDCSGLVYEGSETEHMVGPDGTVAGYCFCWNGENFRKYVAQEMKIYAKIRPHTVWFDDDLRPVNHNPVNSGCFCDNCIKKFNRKYGTDFSREELVDAISYGELKYREMFAEFSRANIYDFAYTMAKTFCEISPDSYMGYQFYCNGGLTGFNFDYIFDGLSDGSGKPSKSRPGGGCYDAHNPNDILGKSMVIDYQNAMLPAYVREIRPEIENLPDVVFGKSIASTCLEATVNLARGANAMSYAMIMNDYESFEWHNEMFSAFSSYRKYWEKLAEISSDTVSGGLPFYHSRNMWKRKLKADEKPLAYEHEPVFCHDFLMTTGIPVTHFQSEGLCLLTGQIAEVISDDDIKALLKRNVITDGLAAKILNERGFGRELGLNSVEIESRAFGVKFERNSIIKNTLGKKWKKSICDSIYDYRLVPLNENVTVLSSYYTNAKDLQPEDGNYPFGIAEALTETEFGGRWAVFGYDPWSNIISTDRRNYLIEVADCLGDKVHAYTESRIQAVVMPRLKNGTVFSVSVVNCELYNSGIIKLKIRNPYGKKPVFTDKSRTLSPVFTAEENEMTVEIPGIDGWSAGTVYFE